jgi:endonuclease/exonuclease/phosphatase family metal-dependent hydrolase
MALRIKAIGLGVVAAALLSAMVPAASAQSLKVMSFNVRYPNPQDDEDRWEARRDMLVKTIRDQAPDIVGTQELFHVQGQYVVEKAPEYAWFGVSRRGNQTDEHMGVFYRKESLKLIDSGNFWLSETPEKPGSVAWDMSLPRMVTWGLFEWPAAGTRLLLWNTHFAHRPQDETARQNSAKLLACRLSVTSPEIPFILTGDFNAPAGGPTYSVLSPPLQDAWLTAGQKSGPEGTFHGFRGKPREGRIDWILYRGPWRVTRMEHLTVNENGRYPSDHFPIVATLEWTGAKPH